MKMMHTEFLMISHCTGLDATYLYADRVNVIKMKRENLITFTEAKTVMHNSWHDTLVDRTAVI